MNRFILLVSFFLLASCKTIEVKNYVHDATEVNRKTLQWARPDAHLEVIPDSGNLPYVVLDFYQFWPGYSGQAYAYIIQSSSESIKIVSIEVEALTRNYIYLSILRVRQRSSLMAFG